MTYDPATGDRTPGQSWPAPPPAAAPGGYGPPPAGWGPPAGYPGGPSGFGPGGAGPSYGPTGDTGSPQDRAKGFFAALFDFGFHSFATPSVVKIVYIVYTVFLGLFYLGAVVSGFAADGAAGLAVLLIGAPVTLFLLTFFRITLEFYYAVIRMSEDIHQRR